MGLNGGIAGIAYNVWERPFESVWGAGKLSLLLIELQSSSMVISPLLG